MNLGHPHLSVKATRFCLSLRDKEREEREKEVEIEERGKSREREGERWSIETERCTVVNVILK